MIGLIYQVLKRLGFDSFKIRINNRKLLNGIAQFVGVEDSSMVELFRSLDKLDKTGKEAVEEELSTKGFEKDVIERLFSILEESPTEDFDLSFFEKKMRDIPIGIEAVDELRQISPFKHSFDNYDVKG